MPRKTDRAHKRQLRRFGTSAEAGMYTAKGRYKLFSSEKRGKYHKAPEYKNPAGRKAVRLKNFTGTIKKNANGTVSIVGRAKRK